MKKFRFLLIVLTCLSPALAKETALLEPHVIVKNLYETQKANQPDQSLFFQTKDRARLNPYFTKSLADLIWKNATESKGEVGKIDFDPMYGSQDPQIKKFAIGSTGLGGDKKFGPEDEAVVQVTFTDSGKEKMVSFRFRQGKDKSWRIDDIRYPDLDNLLLKDLLAPAKTKQ